MIDMQMLRTIIENIVRRMLTPLRNRVYTLITRAVIESVKDDKKLQLVKVNLLAGESRDDVERLQNFGFTGHPHSGAECVAVAVGGNRDHLIVIVADDRRVRVKDLPQGGAAIYSAVEGDTEAKQIMKVLPDGTIELGKAATESVIKGTAFKTFFDTHTHPVISLGSPSGVPTLPMPPTTLSTVVKTE